MAVLAERLAREYPDANRDHGVRVYTLTQGMLDEGTGPILSLWQASAFVVLLIACANIANLMLARAAERRREIGRPARARREPRPRRPRAADGERAARADRRAAGARLRLGLPLRDPHQHAGAHPALRARLRVARRRTCGCSAFTVGARAR